jgi:hypothetical protein
MQVSHRHQSCTKVSAVSVLMILKPRLIVVTPGNIWVAASTHMQAFAAGMAHQTGNVQVRENMQLTKPVRLNSTSSKPSKGHSKPLYCFTKRT